MEENTFSKEELKNILVLISRTNITGNEAQAVALLQHKIGNMIKRETLVPEEVQSEAPTTE